MSLLAPNFFRVSTRLFKISLLRTSHVFRQKFSETTSLLKTKLYDLHVEEGGKMVPFAGYSMAVQYGTHGIAASHVHTRTHVSLFDVSHMMQTRIHGADASALIESITVADLQALDPGQGTLTVFTTESGGIIDDLIVSKTTGEDGGYFYLVSNAGCRDKDLNHLKQNVRKFKEQGKEVDLEVMSDHSLIAVQGPGAAKVMTSLVSYDLTKLPFMHGRQMTVCGVDNCRVSIANEHVIPIVREMLRNKDDQVKFAGLGARDSLRLEAGMCLYGNDIDETTTPIEASLAWLISKRRRETADFPGASTILDQLKKKPGKRRVGFTSEGPPARSATKIVNEKGEQVGTVTSGCPSPFLKKNISMGYVDSKYSKTGSEVTFQIRNKSFKAIVTKMPFVPSNYYTVPKENQRN